MKYIISAILILSMMLEGFAQFNTDTFYPKAKVYLKDHKVLKGKELKVTDSGVSFFDVAGNQQQSLEMTELDFIKIPKGNHLWEGTIIGTATLALSALLIDLDTDALGQPQEKDASFYLAMAGGGAALGALVGILVPKWKPIYLKDKTAGRFLPIEFDILPGERLATIKITLKL